MGKKKDVTIEAMEMNKRTELDYFSRLKMLALSIFKWEGLEEVCGSPFAKRFLENGLFELGKMVFIKDDELGYMVTKVTPSDTLNTYNMPTKVQAWSLTYHKDYNIDDVVMIMNNDLMLPTSQSISLLSKRLYEAQRAIDVNVNAQKTPVLLEGDDKSMLSLENAYMQYSGNSPVLFANKNFDFSNKLNAIKTDAPYIVDKLCLYKHELWNEGLTYLGINNSNTDKKERLITDEVNSNNDLISYYLSCFYNTRKQAVDEINKKWFNGEEEIKIGINKDLIIKLSEAKGE